MTYDDGPGKTVGPGPGPQTLQIGEFLSSQHIAATFFVIGERARALPDVVVKLQELGHLVANHTQSHQCLSDLVSNPKALVDQVLETDSFLHDKLKMKQTFLRPPYGAWWPNDSKASGVAEILNGEAALATCVGPVLWDINGGDRKFWEDGMSAASCANKYRDCIGQKRHGIVLMHDSSWEPHIRERNQGLQMTKLLVPMLRAQGYRFVRLDEIPEVAAAARITR